MNFMFSAKELDKETGFYYYGARYLDPKYSRWISADPAMNTGEYFPMAPVDDNARRHNQNLPGMGGIFNHINANLYHYAGNNPIKYIDPDGRISQEKEKEIALQLNDTSQKTGVDLNLYTANPNQDVFDETKLYLGNMRKAASSITTCYSALYYVAAHGNNKFLASCNSDGSIDYPDRIRPFSAEDLVELIKADSKYNGQPVVLWICNAGKERDDGKDCLAQQVADLLGEGAIVIASTTPVTTLPFTLRTNNGDVVGTEYEVEADNQKIFVGRKKENLE